MTHALAVALFPRVSGRGLLSLSWRTGWHDLCCLVARVQIKYVKGVDLSPGEIDEARRRFQELKPEERGASWEAAGYRAPRLAPCQPVGRCRVLAPMQLIVGYRSEDNLLPENGHIPETVQPAAALRQDLF